MKQILPYLILSLFSMPLWAQERPEPIEYSKGDITFKIVDTLYLPLDTTQTIQFQMINNSGDTIEYGTAFIEEEFIFGKGWKKMKEPVPRKTNDSVTVIRAFDMIGYFLQPEKQREHSISFSPIFKWFYEEGTRYRLVKTFNFKGERDQKYYIWDELVVKQGKENNPYEKTFEAYSNYIFENDGIKCTHSEELIDLQEYFVVQPIRKDRRVGAMYGPVFQTPDENCIIQYPALAWPLRFMKEEKVGDFSYKSQLVYEIKAALGYPDYIIPQRKTTDIVTRIRPVLQDTASIDFNSYVTTIVGKDVNEKFNADTIYVYDIPLQEPFKNKYTYCTGLVIAKEGHASMNFKFYFTVEGKAAERKYLDYLDKQIWYAEN